MNAELSCFLKKEISGRFIVTASQDSETLVLQYLKFSHILFRQGWAPDSLLSAARYGPDSSPHPHPIGQLVTK